MSYIGKNPEADSVKLKGSATEPSGTAVDGQVYFNTGTGSISKGMKVYKNSQFVAIDKQLGDADTMQLLKAADIPAIDFSLSVTSTTVGGHGAVPFESSTGDFDGTAAFTNSSTGDALLTDDSADLVFHYTTQATNNAKNDFWGIPLTVPRAFRGGNLVLEMKYRTEIATGTMDDGYFNIAVLDRSASLQLTMSSTIGTTAIAAGSAVALAGKTYSNPVTSTTLTIAVGDRVFVESGAGTASAANTGDIVDCYVTSVSSTANEITLSKDITPCNLGRITSGWLTGVEAINAFASDTNKDGTSKKIAFKTDADTQQLGLYFLVKGTSTVKHELFFDNVLLSGNKFLQASSQTKSEYYFVKQQADFWDASGSSLYYTWDVSMVTAGDGTPPLADSKLVEVADFAQPSEGVDVTRIFAKQDIVLDVVMNAYHSNGGELTIRNSSADVLQSTYAPNSASAGYAPVMASVNLAKGDYVYFRAHDSGSRQGSLTFTATPQASPTVILESQEEIFNSWTEYTPTLNGVTSTAANTKFAWRRVGDSMEIAGSFYSATVAASELYFTLPSGYEVDQSIFYAGDRTAVGVGSREATSIYGYEKGNTANLFVKAGGTNLDRIYFNAQSGGSYFTAVNGNSWMGTSEAASVRVWSVPIKGWNSNFNPLLSLPLVEYGGDIEEYRAYQFQEGTSVNYRARMTGTLLKNTVSTLGTVTNDSSYGWYLAPNQRVKVTVSWSQACSTTQAGLCVVKYPSTFGSPSTVADANSVNSAWDPYRVTGIQDTNGAGYQGNVSSSFIAEAGDYIQLAFENSNWQTSAKSLLQVTVEKIYSNTTMAHIIKPAVASIRQVKGKGSDGGTISSFTYVDRECNVFEGETWFVTPGTGTLGSGGTCVSFTLEAGTYETSIEGCARECNTNFLRLYNTTDSTVTIQGRNSFSDSTTNNAMPVSSAKGVFTITSAKEFKIQHYAQSTKSASGQGLGIGTGSTNNPDNSIHMEAIFRKLK